MTYNCQSCGACCIGNDVLLTQAEAEEFEREPELAALTTLEHCAPGLMLRFMRKDPQTERCVALAGPLDNCRCTIYPRRPLLCRELAPGSPDCIAARQRLGRDDSAAAR